MAAIYAFLRRRRQNIRRNRVFRDRDNPLDYTDDADIISKYRLSRPSATKLGMHGTSWWDAANRFEIFDINSISMDVKAYIYL
jgi:hypothetical protein